MKGKIYLLLVLFVILNCCNANYLFSQAPGNTCATAVNLALPAIGNTITTGAQTTCGRGNNVAAGFSSVNTNYGGGEDAYYSITVPAGGGNYTFTYANSGATWKILSIHTGCAPTTVNTVGGFVTGTGAGGTITLDLAAGTYILVIDTWPTPACGAFTLSITRNNPPCASAINIPSVPVTNQALVCNATAVPGALNATNVPTACGGASNNYKGGQDAIYTFTPTTSGNYTISYSGQTWSAIFVYSGACPASGGTCVGSVGSAASTQSITVAMTAGVQYFIWFDTWPAPNSPCPGTFSITLPFNPCASITNITACGTGVSTSWTAGQTGAWNPPATSCGFATPQQERIFTFTPTVTGNHQINITAITGGYVDFWFKPVSGGCNNTGWTCLGDRNTTGVFGTLNLTAGVQYYILTDPEFTGAGSLTFNVVCPPSPPTNDACINATSLACGANLAGTTVAAVSEPAPLGCGNNFGVWYTFTGDGQQTTISSPSPMDHSLNIMSGSSCGSFTSIACVDDFFAGGTESFSFTTTPGVQYYVYVAHFQTGSTTTGTFNISRTCAPSPCATAVNLLCGVPVTAAMNGGGLGWNPASCGWSTPGQEIFYQFTAPATGTYQLNISSISGGYIDFFWKPASGGCSSAGWNCIGDLNSAGTYGGFTPMNFTAGTTYYILLDPEVTSATNVTFSLICPCGTNSTAPTAITGTNTICSGSSTTLTTSGGSLGTEAEDIWYQGACANETYTQEFTNLNFTTSNTTVNAVSNGVVSVSSTNNDPMIWMTSVGAFPAASFRWIQFRYRVTSGTAGQVEIYYSKNGGADLSESQVVRTGLISDGQWRFVNLDMSTSANWTGIITGWRLDYATNSGATVEIDFITLADQPILDIGTSITVSPTINTTYFTRKKGCNSTTCASQLVTVNTLSTTPTLTTISGTVCPNTNITLTASGGTAGTGSTVMWYTGPNGTGSLLGTGNSIVIAPAISSTIYARREGTCNTTADASTTVNVKSFVYASNNTTTSNYCQDNAGWNHFFVGDEIIFSVQGDLFAVPVGFPQVTIYDNGTFYQSNTGPNTAADCANNLPPGEEQFEMERSWNVDLGGGMPIGTYNIRFYFPPAERSTLIAAANAWMSMYPACAYTYKYAVPDGFFWFKNSFGNYAAPQWDGVQYAGTPGTINGINYTQWNGLTSFSGGSGGIILVPDEALPVQLASFTANCKDGRVLINWSTSAEINNSHFVLERSQNGDTWQSLETVPGAGNSNTTQHYQSIDAKPFNGVSYYRLTQVDYNGTSETFSPVTVTCVGLGNNDYSLLYPNPTEGSFTLEIQAGSNYGNGTVEIMDMVGRKVITRNIQIQEGTNVLSFGDENLRAGTYHVSIQLNGVSLPVQKLVVK